MKNIILFGPPGCGKGTQSKLLIEKYNLNYLATGDLLRHEITISSKIGVQAAHFMKRGALVPDDLVMEMLKEKSNYSFAKSNLLFDGFPRTINQAKMLDEMLETLQTSIEIVISLEVATEELVTRILERQRNENRLDDRNETIIRNRLDEYVSKTEPLKEFYKDKLKIVSGIQSVDDIFKEICNIVSSN